MSETRGSEVARDFVARFEDFWRAPDPQILGSLLTDDVHLVQPVTPATTGLAAATTAFARLLEEIPDLRGTIDRWRGDEEIVFVELRLHGTLGRRPVGWPLTDRFALRGNKASERVSYFDGIAVARQLARRPLTMARLLRR